MYLYLIIVINADLYFSTCEREQWPRPLTPCVQMPLWPFPALLPINLIKMLITGLHYSANSVHLSLLCPLQLLPSIVAPWLRRAEDQTQRVSLVKRSRGRSRDPGSVFGYIITNRKSLQAGHTGPLPSFVYSGVWIKLPMIKLYNGLLPLNPFSLIFFWPYVLPTVFSLCWAYRMSFFTILSFLKVALLSVFLFNKIHLTP